MFVQVVRWSLLHVQDFTVLLRGSNWIFLLFIAVVAFMSFHSSLGDRRGVLTLGGEVRSRACSPSCVYSGLNFLYRLKLLFS